MYLDHVNQCNRTIITLAGWDYVDGNAVKTIANLPITTTPKLCGAQRWTLHVQTTIYACKLFGNVKKAEKLNHKTLI